jgi:hypothetical protein
VFHTRSCVSRVLNATVSVHAALADHILVETDAETPAALDVGRGLPDRQRGVGRVDDAFDDVGPTPVVPVCVGTGDSYLRLVRVYGVRTGRTRPVGEPADAATLCVTTETTV